MRAENLPTYTFPRTRPHIPGLPKRHTKAAELRDHCVRVKGEGPALLRSPSHCGGDQDTPASTWEPTTYTRGSHGERTAAYPSPAHGPVRCPARRVESTHGREFWSLEDTVDHLLSDYAWSQGSRGPQMGYLGDPWVLAAHRGPVDQDTLSDL